MVIAQMRENAGPTAVEADSIEVETSLGNDDLEPPALEQQTHIPNPDVVTEGMTLEEAKIEDGYEDMPELLNPEDDDEDEGTNTEDNEQTTAAPDEGRPQRTNAGKKELDSDSIWSVANISVQNGIRSFRMVAENACHAEFE